MWVHDQWGLDLVVWVEGFRSKHMPNICLTLGYPVGQVRPVDLCRQVDVTRLSSKPGPKP